MVLGPISLVCRETIEEETGDFAHLLLSRLIDSQIILIVFLKLLVRGFQVDIIWTLSHEGFNLFLPVKPLFVIFF